MQIQVFFAVFQKVAFTLSINLISTNRKKAKIHAFNIFFRDER
jgi:hypothetical protein